MDADQDEIDFETKRKWAAVTEVIYVVVLEDGGLENASAFQGISNRFDELGWTLRQILDLPPDLLSPALPPQGKIGMRVTGRGWNWMPLMVSELEKINISETAPFWVAISGHAEVAKRTKRWCSRQRFPVFHITDGYLGDARPGEANRERIRRHLRKVMQRLPKSFPPPLRANLVEIRHLVCTSKRYAHVARLPGEFVRQIRYHSWSHTEFVDRKSPITNLLARFPCGIKDRVGHQLTRRLTF